MRARMLLAVGLVAAAAAVLVALRGDGSHTLRAAFHGAVNVVGGQEVRIAGRKVGRVGSVEEIDGEAVVELEVDDDAWPLRRGTMARLRYGSVSGYAARYVELHPGGASAPALPDGGVLTSADTVTPVEFDEIFSTFDARTRRDLGGLIENAAATLDGRGASLARALEDGSPGVQQLAELMAELGSDRDALRVLVRAGARTSAALRRREPALRRLLDHLAATSDELAGHARAQQAALDAFPSALGSGRRMLRRLDTSLAGLQGLTDDLRPGARGLRGIAPVARRTTTALDEVAPAATRTLAAGADAAPAIDRLLRASTPFMPRLASVLDGAGPMMACLRPYGPEIAGFLSTWLSSIGVADGPTPYARILVTQPPAGMDAGTRMTSQQLVDAHRGRLSYALPRPPGLNAGRPWLQPECGAGRDALDASKDPERRGGGR